MDLWLVTCLNQDSQYVVAGAGRWSRDARPGMRFPWHSSLCARMVAGRAPAMAADITHFPAYLEAAVGPLAKVRAYLGVPLFLGDSVFGTLCAFAGTAQPETLSRRMPLVRLTGRMLSSLITAEHAAHERSMDAARAYSLAERDALTGLRNRRGFEAMSASEDARCRLFGSHASVLFVHIESPAGDEELAKCAQLITSLCRGCDTVSRIDANVLAILAVETDLMGARALSVRLRKTLRAADFSVSIGVASRRTGERIADTGVRAEQALRLDQRRHAHPREIFDRARAAHAPAPDTDRHASPDAKLP
jgi:diguanylate cyclase